MIKSFGHHVSIIYRYLQIWINDQLEPLGIGSGQYMFFNHISRNEGISQKELSSRIAVDKATTAKAVRKLTGLGYIEARINGADNRIHNLYLTDAGWKIVPRVRSVLKETTEIMLEGMSSEEIETAGDILDKLLCNISGKIGRSCE